MMEKNYELVAWTKNITDPEKARLHLDPSVENEIIRPLVSEVSKCFKIKQDNNGYISLKLAKRFVRVYLQSARLDIFIGHIDTAIRFLLKAAEHCIIDKWQGQTLLNSDVNPHTMIRKELIGDFACICEEIISLSKRYGFEYILDEKRNQRVIDLYLEYIY